MATNYFRMDGWVKSAQGPAVPGAQIYVCTQPANAVGLPPTPLANIFSDVNGLVPITQPIITDGFGHYDFYATAAVYTIVVGLGGVIQQVYPDQSIGGASGTTGGGGGTALVLATKGVVNPNQLALNIESTDNSVSISVDSSGNLNLEGAPVAVADYMFGAGNFTIAGILGVTQQAFTDTALQVKFARFTTPFSLDFSKMDFVGGSNLGPGSDINVAVYDKTGTTKLWSSGSVHIPNVTNTNFSVALSQHLILSPGTYLLVWTANDNGNGTVFGWDVGTFTFHSGGTDENIVNQNTVTYGFASNPATSGPTFPSTLGTLTPNTGAYTGLPAFFFQK